MAVWGERDLGPIAFNANVQCVLKYAPLTSVNINSTHHLTGSYLTIIEVFGGSVAFLSHHLAPQGATFGFHGNC